MILRTLIFCFFVVTTACSTSDSGQEDFEKEIAAIENNAQLAQYLTQIEIADQKYRRMEDYILEKYGYDSQEYRDIWEMINLVDQQNLKKIDLLFEKFGYPKKAIVGARAAEIPLLVIHHAAGYESYMQYFPQLYDAWKAGDLSDNTFSLFLERIHMMKFDSYFSYPGPYQHDEKIEALIRKLEL